MYLKWKKKPRQQSKIMSTSNETFHWAIQSMLRLIAATEKNIKNDDTTWKK